MREGATIHEYDENSQNLHPDVLTTTLIAESQLSSSSLESARSRSVFMLFASIPLSGPSRSGWIRKTESGVKKELIGINEKDDDKILKLFLKYPRALERPIVIFGNKAVIGRPPKKIYDLFELEKEG